MRISDWSSDVCSSDLNPDSRTLAGAAWVAARATTTSWRTDSGAPHSRPHRDAVAPVAHETDLAAVHLELLDQGPPQRGDHPGLASDPGIDAGQVVADRLGVGDLLTRGRVGGGLPQVRVDRFLGGELDRGLEAEVLAHRYDRGCAVCLAVARQPDDLDSLGSGELLDVGTHGHLEEDRPLHRGREVLEDAGHGRHCRLVTDQQQVGARSEEHTSELQSLMRISYAAFCLNKKTNLHDTEHTHFQAIITLKKTTPHPIQYMTNRLIAYHPTCVIQP